MQPGEGRAKIGVTLDRVLKTQTTDVQYRIWYCPCCLTLFRQVVDTEVEDNESAA